MLSISNTAAWTTYPHPFDLVAHILKHRDENSSKKALQIVSVES